MAQDYSTTQAHNLFIFSYQTQSISFGHSSTYLSQADVSSQCSFRTKSFQLSTWTRREAYSRSSCVMRIEWINSSTTKNLLFELYGLLGSSWQQLLPVSTISRVSINGTTLQVQHIQWCQSIDYIFWIFILHNNVSIQGTLLLQNFVRKLIKLIL